MGNAECRFAGDPEYIRYEASADANALEEVQSMTDALKREAELREGWIYTTLVKAECDPAGWCRASVEWTEKRLIGEAADGD